MKNYKENKKLTFKERRIIAVVFLVIANILLILFLIFLLVNVNEFAVEFMKRALEQP